MAEDQVYLSVTGPDENDIWHDSEKCAGGSPIEIDRDEAVRSSPSACRPCGNCVD